MKLPYKQRNIYYREFLKGKKARAVAMICLVCAVIVYILSIIAMCYKDEIIGRLGMLTGSILVLISSCLILNLNLKFNKWLKLKLSIEEKNCL